MYILCFEIIFRYFVWCSFQVSNICEWRWQLLSFDVPLFSLFHRACWCNDALNEHIFFRVLMPIRNTKGQHRLSEIWYFVSTIASSFDQLLYGLCHMILNCISLWRIYLSNLRTIFIYFFPHILEPLHFLWFISCDVFNYKSRKRLKNKQTDIFI